MTKKDELDEQTAKQLSLSIVDMCRTVLRSVKKNDLDTI